MGKNIDYMIEIVKDYIAGKTPRYIFELDFQAEILNRYKKMAREDRDYAEYFYDLLSEDGVDAGDGLTDIEFKQWIRKQYNRVKCVVDEGFW